jgi:type III secretion protein L
MSWHLVSRGRTRSLYAGDPVIRREDIAAARTGLELLAAIEREAEAEMARARDLAADAEEEGRERGYRDGRRAAEAECARMLLDMEKAAARSRAELRARTVTLAMEVVRRIAGRLGEDAAVAAMAEQAAAELVPEGPVTLRVHPARLAAVRSRLAAHADRISVEADEDLAETGCTLQSSWGRIDAGLETQLETLAAALEETA